MSNRHTSTEGTITILFTYWIFLQRWYRVNWRLTNGTLEYWNENISERIEMWEVHSFRNAENSTNMMEMRAKGGTYYMYNDTEREKDAFMNLIGGAIINSYAVGYGDVALDDNDIAEDAKLNR